MDSIKNEHDSADLDGPSKGAQSARSLAPAAETPSEAHSQCRILVTKEASQSLDEMAAKIGEGFEGGRIGRPQIVSWILLRFAERMSETDVDEVRATFFDRIAYLESLVKRAKDSGTVPAELEAIFPIRGPSQKVHTTATRRSKGKKKNNPATSSVPKSQE